VPDLPQKWRLLRAYAEAGEAGLTDEEAAERVPIGNGRTLLDSGSSWWKRCTDLRELHYIEPPAEREHRKGRMGVDREVHVITSMGREALKALRL
jgi:hypothetical protein